LSRDPDWTVGEFAILVSSPGLAAADLTADLPRRSVGAIGVVRNGICGYHHNGEHHGMLSRMMVAYLERRTGTLTCAECGGWF
jgi:hypothetical protein